jgi:cytochrome c oxidase cbb3-type subunit 3
VLVSKRLLAATLVFVAACQPDRGEVREWVAADHDPTGADPRLQRGQERPPATKEDTSVALADTIWRKNCATCHGPEGRGDGPQGPMVGAQDLTRDEWLSAAKDEEIAATIRKGKNRMPAFPDLPDAVLQGLVKRIRAKGRPAPAP